MTTRRHMVVVGTALLIAGFLLGFFVGQSAASGANSAVTPASPQPAPTSRTTNTDAPESSVVPQDNRSALPRNEPAARPGTQDPPAPKPSVETPPVSEQGKPTTSAQVLGAVQFSGAAPQFDVQVGVARAEDGRAGSTFQSVSWAKPPEFASRFEQLPPGAYLFEARLPLGAILGSGTHTHVAGTNQIAIAASAPRDGETLVVRALDANGNPVAPENLVVTVGYEGAGGNASDHGRLAVLADGTVLIPRVLPPVASDRAFVNVMSLAHGATRLVPLQEAQNGVITVRFGRLGRATVNIHLTGPRPASPRIGAAIVHRGARGDTIRTPFYDTWFDGNEKRIVDVAPGEADIVIVTAETAATNDLKELSRQAVTIVEGDNSFFVPTPVIGELVIRVDALFVELYPANLGQLKYRRATTMTREGRATFAALPEGVWRVVPYSGDDAPMGEAIVRTPAWTEVPFEAAARMEAHVAQLEPGGAAATAGLKQYDVIVAVNETELNSGFLWSKHLRTFVTGNNLKLEVMRGNQRITLTAPGTVFADRAAAGALILLRQP